MKNIFKSSFVLALVLGTFCFNCLFVCEKAQARSKRVKTTEATTQAKKDVGIKGRGGVAFIGCPGSKNKAIEVMNVLAATEKAWNEHNVYGLLAYYVDDFSSRDGSSIEDIKENLGEFWLEYPDSKIESLVTSVYACGDYASVTIVEEMTGTEKTKPEDLQLEGDSKFKSVIRGFTTLKLIDGKWKIADEDIQSEIMWKYYGKIAEELVESGKLSLIVPEEVVEGKNYVAQVVHSLPEKTRAVAFIDKVLLGEFKDKAKNAKKDEDKKDQKDVAEDEQRRKELLQISRPLEDSEESQEGLRRLFKANELRQSEMVKCQVELVSFLPAGTDKDNNKLYRPYMSGIVAISQRVRVRPEQHKEKVKERVTIPFFEE